ncbi:hypothetical protein [Nonomuraea angiospora]|uniref:hypothetical protein n=1 Tax=Nonomuraea angiospora TaxID=46172 RepID=UPI0029BA3BA1|nr:hypothetical protein [Nonomuraea angiospora]MDX3100483.1 hypothetical protein [Nonomuraea angiospora]
MTTEPTAAASPADLSEAVKKAGPYNSLWTPSALNAATALLADLLAAAQRHGVTAADWIEDGENRLIQAVTTGLVANYNRASQAELDDPLALLTGAAAACDLRVLGSGAEEDGAYVMLARQPETPAWGPGGQSPLLVILAREEDAWWMEGLGPWKWRLRPHLPAGVTVPAYTTPWADIVAPPPSADVAAEVFAIAGQVLAGTVTLQS